MPLVTFGGLASGLDTNAIIRSLLQAERQPVKLLQRKQDDARSQLSILQAINLKIQTLKTRSEGLDSLRELEALRATSSDEGRIGVRVTSEASAGSYEIDNVVRALAQKSRSNAFAQKTDLLATGTLLIRQGGTDYAITLDATNNTLEGLVNAINGAQGLDVTASLFYDGTTYRVLLSSDRTGTDAAFTVDESGLSGGAPPGFSDAGNLVQAARNASFTLEGQPVVSQSNTVTGVLPGLSFELRAEFSASPVAVVVSPDADAVAAKVSELVTAYNDAVAAIQAQFQYAGDGKPAPSGSLFGDSTLRALQQRIAALVTETVSGLPESLNSLNRVGVSLGRDGKLTLDEAKLRSAVSSDLRGVARIFARDSEANPPTTGIAARLAEALEAYVNPTSGLLHTKESSLNDRIRDMEDRIATMERRLDAYEESLRAQFTALERLMSQLQAQGNFLVQQLAR
jgi:flagellar hook-associated protein 2